MNTFSIRDIENLCGIKAHTLRAWELRYNFMSPKRKAGNHRLYDGDDLRYLLRISYLYHNGYKISSIARLKEEEMVRLALSIPPAESADAAFMGYLTEASMDFDENRFDKLLNNIIQQAGFENAISRVITPFLHRIGLLWLTGNVIPAQEHFAAGLIIRKIAIAIGKLAPPPPRADKQMLLFCPKGEYHEIPLLYMNYLLKKNGNQVIYMGRNVAMEDLVYYISRKPVTHIYFHLITNLLRCEPEEYLKKLVLNFPDQQIIMSGNSNTMRANLDVITMENPNVRLLKGIEEMTAFALE